jgi:hypothetical protein
MAELPHRSDSGPWIIRMAVRRGAGAVSAMDPLIARTHEEVGLVLSGLLAAITLLGVDDHTEISITPGLAND